MTRAIRPQVGVESLLLSPPEYCGGPTGYQLMQKRQQEGESMGTPAQVEAVIALTRDECGIIACEE
jgi:hypothetical protein